MLKLKPGIRYLAFDFETTGLDHEKDEPIQIGIVVFDHTGTTLETFSSLIKPQKPLQELKTIVGFVTGLNIEDLQNAPTFEELKPTIAAFFEQPAVIIGHNINFDINFFKKYLPWNEHHHVIDTFGLSQSCIPYAPSYALETLVNHLQGSEEWKHQLTTFFPNGINGNAHDALTDTQYSMVLWAYCTQSICKLLETYPVLHHVISHSTSPWKQILPLQVSEHILQLPALKKVVPSPQHLTHPQAVDLSQLMDRQTYYSGNELLETVLLKLLHHRKIIFAFSHKSKLEIAKTLLQKHHFDDIGFLKEEQDFDPLMIKAFLNKSLFDQQEVHFVIKYLIHHLKGYGILHIITPDEYKLFFALKIAKRIEWKDIILTTHSGVLSYQDKQLIPQEYTILFFDQEWWYKSSNSFFSQTFDVYTLLTALEHLHYKYQFINPEAQGPLQDFINFVAIFIGVRYAEITQRRKGRQENSLNCEALIADGMFRKPAGMLSEFQNHMVISKEFLQSQDQELIEQHIQTLLKIIDGPYTIEKRMYQQSDFFYVFRSTYAYINYQEFLELFGSHRMIALSHENSSLPHLTQGHVEPSSIPHIKYTTSSEIIEYILQHPQKNIAVLSYSKEKSKELFQGLVQQGCDKITRIVAENITGGIGKTLSLAKSAPHKIVIGGYEYILTSFSHGISFDIVIFFNIVGNMSERIYHDIVYYGRQ